MKDFPDEIAVPHKVMSGGYPYTPSCCRATGRMPRVVDAVASHLGFGRVVRPPTNEVSRHSPEGEKRPTIPKPSGGGR